MISRLCLGTAQFGLEYGIANRRGIVPQKEVFEIFKFAQRIGLKTLDTSIAYGDSERIIGEFIAETGIPFEIVSKILVDSDRFDPNDIRLKLQGSLQRLKVKQLYGCLIHRFEDFLKHDRLWGVLEASKKDGLIGKIGFSLYRPEDLGLIWDRGISFDIVQVPFSVFDRRFEKELKLLKDKGVEIHVRSIFLQGLVFLNPDQLPDKLSQASEPIQHLQRISEKYNLSISAVCLNYVLLNPFVDKVLIGVDGLGHLKDNVRELGALDKARGLKEELNNLAIADEEVLLPFKWN